MTLPKSRKFGKGHTPFTKEDFLSGKPFKIFGKDEIYLFDGRVIKIKQGEYFDFYCTASIPDIHGVYATTKFFTRQVAYYITFSKCVLTTE